MMVAQAQMVKGQYKDTYTMRKQHQERQVHQVQLLIDSLLEI